VRPFRKKIPKVLNQRIAQTLLEADGWTMVAGGKHQIKMTKPRERPITLPAHGGKDYPTGLAEAILKQAGLGRRSRKGRE
jgi:predicted RNA binding protein YcfA (HicA-like mRNA interferase family)